MSNFLIFFGLSTWKEIKKCDIFTSLAHKAHGIWKNNQGRKERVRSANNTKVLNDELKRESKNEKFEDYKTLDLYERKVVVNQVPFNKEGTNWKWILSLRALE